MLEYDRIDISEGIDAKKTNVIFVIIGTLKILVLNIKYEPYLCNGCLCNGLM